MTGDRPAPGDAPQRSEGARLKGVSCTETKQPDEARADSSVA